MFARYGMALLAVIGAIAAGVSTRMLQSDSMPKEPVWTPSVPSDDGPRVAGLGLVEPPGEAIAIGTPVSGIVMRVAVEPGRVVKAGGELFALDDRELKRDLALREAEWRTMKAKLERLKAMPRPEELPAAKRKVDASSAASKAARDKADRMQRLAGSRAVPEEEVIAQRLEAERQDAMLAESQAQLKLLESGAWKPELEIAVAEVEQAAAAVDRVRAALERLTVRAPVDLTVLRVSVRAGEFAEAGRLADPLLLAGRTGALHVRTEFDEAEADRIDPAAPAEAVLRGRKVRRVPLKFVRFEPWVRPKKSLTGDSTERVDTRVLIAVYEVVGDAGGLQVGRQADVFVRLSETDVREANAGKLE